MLRGLLIVLVLWGTAPRAQTAAPQLATEGDGMAALMQSLPDKTVKKLRDAPERFVETAAGLILGFGGAGGIDMAGIDRFIAVERARHRAGAMRRLLLADLDNDGATTRAEMAVLVAAAGAAERGRLDLAFRRADEDGNGTVPMAELRIHAQAVALKELSATEAETLRGFLAFDVNGDARVSLDEVMRVVAAFEQKV